MGLLFCRKEEDLRAYIDLLRPGHILLYGHTHIPTWEAFGNSDLYRDPRSGSAHSYMILQENTILWRSLDGSLYHEETL